MLPVNETSHRLTKEQLDELYALYKELRASTPDGENLLVNQEPGIVFKPDIYKERYPTLVDIQTRYPFLEDKCSFIITNAKVEKFRPHSDDSHASVFTIIEGDDTAVTTWYKIKNVPVFNFTSNLYGCIAVDENIEVKHKEILKCGTTYLFDSHSFHSVKNTTKNSRIIFTWWLKHIAYHPAYEYYLEHGLLAPIKPKE